MDERAERSNHCIVLTGKKELDIYVNPQRQRLLRVLALEGCPVTPKTLSDRMGISPSSVQYHLKKLISLGLVAQHHTKKINGITAHFYRLVPCTISIGRPPAEGHMEERIALMQNGVSGVFNGFANYLRQANNGSLPAPPLGDLLWGIARLSPQEATELHHIIHRFLEAHEPSEVQGDAWEYALIAYPVKEEPHA